MTPDERDDLYALAGEYVLGSLEREDVVRIEKRLEHDATLREAVAFWQDRLLPLALSAGAVEPRAAQWTAIAAALPSGRTATTHAASTSWWNHLGFWRLATAVAFAAMFALGIFTVLRTAQPAQTYVAVLTAPDRSAGWIVRAEPGRPLTLVPLVDVPVDPSKSLQFWTLIDKAKGPVSLGLVTPNQALQVPASALPGLVEGQLFEITLEPYGGSPANRPTGAILWKGLAVRT